MWIDPSTHEIFTLHHQIRRAFPRVSFPAQMQDADIEFVGLVRVVQTPQPEHDPETQIAVPGEPEQADGGWQQTWTIQPRPPAPVPTEVEGWQAEVAMRATPVDPEDAESQSVWDRVQDLVAAMPDGIQKITAQTVLSRGKIRRDSPMLAQLAPMVPLTEEQVDDLLRLAASIEA